MGHARHGQASSGEQATCTSIIQRVFCSTSRPPWARTQRAASVQRWRLFVWTYCGKSMVRRAIRKLDWLGSCRLAAAATGGLVPLARSQVSMLA